jgi:hypothetical protein
MMSLRYHVVSLAAVVLALALGVVLGASALSGQLLGALNDDRADLAGRVSQLEGTRAALDRQLQSTEQLVDASAPAIVAGTLPGRSVAVVSTADADPGDLAAVTTLVGDAGAQVTGRVSLTDAAVAPDRAEALRALVPRLLPAGAQLPTTTDTAALTGSLLGSLVAAHPGAPPGAASGPEAQTALAGLADAGYLRVEGPLAPTTATLLVVVTGAGADPGRARTVAHLATALDRGGVGAVLAGRTGSGAVEATRADPALSSGLSTVDGVEGGASRVAAVLALREQGAGRAGAYGPAAGSFTPPPPPA